MKIINYFLRKLGFKLIYVQPSFEWKGTTLYLPLSVDYGNHCIIDKKGNKLDIEFQQEEDLRFISRVFNLAGH